MGKNYIHWRDYYKRNFSEAYQKALQYRLDSGKGENPQSTAFDIYAELFSKSVELLELYLLNNGLFQFDMYEIIRECYYINFLDDGDEWLTTLNLYVLLLTDTSKKEYMDMFTTWVDGNFYIFDHLDDNFNSMVAKNE